MTRNVTLCTALPAERIAAERLRGWPRLPECRAPFGIARAEAVLDELELGVHVRREYGLLCAARAAREGGALAAPDMAVYVGVDVGLRWVAIARILYAVGGLRSAMLWAGIDESTASADLRRWLKEEEK